MTMQALTASTVADPRVRSILRSGMIARIATVSPSGRPLIMPLFFVVLGGRLYMNNAATSPTVRNIAAHPDVLILIEGPAGALLRVRGTARYLRDATTARRVERSSFVKYYLRPSALWRALRDLGRLPTLRQYHRERVAGGMIEVTPASCEISSV